MRLFIQSDPLNREVEGAGVHVLRSMGWGAATGLAGGLISGPVMLATGVSLRSTSLSLRAFALHLFISTLIGVTYGLLFRNEAASVGHGVAWGWLFGLIGWYAGPLTLQPLLLTGECDWSTAAASALLPSMMGHLIYGAVTALTFLILERRYTRWLLLDSKNRRARSQKNSPRRHTRSRAVVPRVGLRRPAADPSGLGSAIASCSHAHSESTTVALQLLVAREEDGTRGTKERASRNGQDALWLWLAT